MAQQDAQALIRMSDDLKERLAETAKQNHRSLSAEISARLLANLDGADNSADRIIERFGSTEERLIEFGIAVGETTTNTQNFLSAWGTQYQSDMIKVIQLLSAGRNESQRLFDLADEQRKEISELRRELSELRRELSDIRRKQD